VRKAPAAQLEEDTAHSLRTRNVGAPVTLGSFARTDQKGRNDSKPVVYSGQVALRDEKYGLSAVITSCHAIVTIDGDWISWSVKFILVFASTVIPGFGLLYIHDKDFNSLLDTCDSKWGILFNKGGMGLSM
jgi:hypothetical protein